MKNKWDMYHSSSYKFSFYLNFSLLKFPAHFRCRWKQSILILLKRQANKKGGGAKYLKTLNYIKFCFQVSCNSSRKENKSCRFKKPIRFFLLIIVIFFLKRLIRFVNNLKINPVCWSLTDCPAKFRKSLFC